MDRYVRLNQGVANKGSLVPLDVFKDPKKIQQYLNKAPNKDWYTSVYSFGKEAKEYFNKNGRIRGYNGSANTSKILFDFDSSDLKKAKQDSIELLSRLTKEYGSEDILGSIRVFFSGGKGFHIELYTKEEFKPKEHKTICRNLTEGLDSWDSTVYNTTALIRLPNTKHQETGLYKIELEPSDLWDLSIEQIKNKAKTKTTEKFITIPLKNVSFLDKYKKKEEKAAYQPVEVEEGAEGVRGLNQVDFSKCPSNKPLCIHALEHGIMISGNGERNALFLRLAAYYKNQGLPKDVAYNALKGIARENKRLYPEHDAYTKDELWNTVISSVYSDNGDWKQIPGAAGTDPNNEMLKKYCEVSKNYTNKSCCLHDKGKSSGAKTMQIDDVSDSFMDFAENFDDRIVKTGISSIDDNMKIMTNTTTLLVGCSGSGKTSVALNIMERANALGQHTAFFSLDMPKNLVYLKLASKVTDYSQEQILNFYKQKNESKVQEVRNKIKKVYDKTYFNFSGTLTFEQMRDTIFNIEKKSGNKIRLVVVDYASRITGPYSDRYANATYNALKSKEIADDTNSAWLIISQISRATGDGCSPLRTKRAAKESGDWEEAASNVITCWRPFMGDLERDDVMRIFLAKNRMGPEKEMVLHWDGPKGKISDMKDWELEDYKVNREEEEKDYLKSRFLK